MGELELTTDAPSTASLAAPSPNAALDAARERMRLMVDADAVGVLFFDTRSGAVIDANEAFLAMSGYTRDDVRSGRLDWQTMTPHEYYDISIAQLEKLAATGKIGPYEKEYYRKDGSRVWMMFSGRDLGDGTLIEYAFDISRFKRTESILRANDDCQTFLLKLSDAIRPLTTAAEIYTAAAHLLGEHLRMSRVRFADIEREDAVTRAEYVSGVPPMPTRYKYTELGHAVVTAFRRGDPIVVTNAKYDPRFDTIEREKLLACQITAFVAVLKSHLGRPDSAIICHSATPRDWTSHEVTLIHETADRAWAAAERADAQAALHATQQRLQSFYDTAPFMMGIGEVIDNHCYMVSANQKTSDFFGRRPEDMAGRTSRQLGTCQKVESLWLEQVRKSEREGRPVRFEYLNERSPQTSWLQATVAIISGSGEPSDRTRYSFVVEDITAYKLADDALHESEVRSRTLLEGIAQATWEGDANGAQVVGSPSWGAYTGQSMEEMTGEGWVHAIHPDDREYALRTWREAVAAQRPLNAEFRLHAPDGAYRWTNVRAAPLFNDDGTVRKWVGMNIDIDDRKRCELALREAGKTL